jgi:hypothetical protein
MSLIPISDFLKSVKRGYNINITKIVIKKYSMTKCNTSSRTPEKADKRSGKTALKNAGPKYIAQKRKRAKIIPKKSFL